MFLNFKSIFFKYSADWVSVATWRWIANDDNCGICRMPFESCCTECTLPGDDCPLGRLKCSITLRLRNTSTYSNSFIKLLPSFSLFIWPFSLGCLLALFPHALHCQMVEFTIGSSTAVSDVSTGLEIQRKMISL